MKTDYIFYTYRCKSCTRVVTKLQVLAMMSGQSFKLCPCGGSQIAPCDLVGSDWFQPRVWKLAIYHLLGRLAPPPEATRYISA
jgi:hypothetical protein